MRKTKPKPIAKPAPTMTLEAAVDIALMLEGRGVPVRVPAVRLWPPWKVRAASMFLDRFPSFEDWIEERSHYPACRVCGCSEDDPCDEGCEWVEADLCSACVVEDGA